VELRFYIDPETDAPHIYNHKVRESEVEEVLANPGEDRPGRDGSRVAVGQTLSGRLLRVIVRSTARQRICDNCLRFTRKARFCLPATQAQNTPMKQSKYPPGWDEQRVRGVLSQYESQSEEEAVAEDEASREGTAGTVMEVPTELVPKVRELIAKYKKA